MDHEPFDPNRADTLYGQTPLGLAAEQGSQGVVRVLLEREDVDINATDKYGKTPLDLAVRCGYPTIKYMLRGEFPYSQLRTNFATNPARVS